MYLTIGVIVFVLLLMFITLFFILKNIIGDINEKGKEYFALKLSELDSQNAKNAKKEIKKSNTIEENIESNTGKNENNNDKSNIIVYQAKNINDYDVKELLQLVKKVDGKFNFDNRYIVTEFARQTEGDDSVEKYNELLSLKRYIESIGMYSLLIKSDEELDAVIQEFSNISKETVDMYYKISDKFDIQDFVNYLNLQINLNDPTIYVFVGSRGTTYNDISTKIKTVYRDDVYKGIKILYKNIIYDYSLG